MVAAFNHDAVTAWSDDARAIAAQARVLSGEKLDQLVRRLQRHSGHSKESCWRFVMQIGLKIRDEHRRWTEAEIETLREYVVTHTIAETAKVLGRSVKSIRCALERNDLKIRELRCDMMSIDSLAKILHVRKTEIQSWIEKGWLEATVRTHGKQTRHIITPEAFERSTRAISANSSIRNESPTWRCSRRSTTTASCPSTQSVRNSSPFAVTSENVPPMKQARRKTENSMRKTQSSHFAKSSRSSVDCWNSESLC